MKFIIFQYLILRVLSSKNYVNDINVNDILRTDLMPTYFMVDDENKGKITNATGLHRTVNGTMDAAFSTMNFHRKMMNEYQCRNFVAEQILEEMNRPVLQNRAGKPFGPNHQKNVYQIMRNNVLYDVGSTNYQDWLDRFEIAGVFDDQTVNASTNYMQPREGYAVYDGNEGIGYGQPIPQTPAYDVSKYSGGMEYAAPPPPLYQHPTTASIHEHVHEYEDHESHGLVLSDLFEIALTGIAFLSFGMFVLQVLMCISMNKQPQLMQMVDNTGDKLSIDDTIRFKRWALEAPSASSLPNLNKLARHALVVLRPALPQCLHRGLCLSNRHARSLSDGTQYLLPIWNVGVSWRWGSAGGARGVGGALRAAALGLGGAHCDKLYPPNLCSE